MKSSCLTLAIACLVMIFIGSGISHANLRDGLVSAWLFDDGTAKDSIGKNNGKIEGKPKVVEGKFGKALSFDGKADYVNLGDTKNFPNGSDERTVAFWTLLRDSSATDNYFMSWGSHTDGAFFGPRIYSGGNISLMVHNGGVYEDIQSDTHLREILDVWSHLAYTYDGDTTAEIYLNGSLIFTGDTGGVLNTSTGHDAYIGARNVGGFNNGIDASIDEVCMWSRVLSDDEIASLAKNSIGQFLSVDESSRKLSTLWGIIKR